MSIKPEYLIHWTGKDLSTDLENLPDDITTKYVDRLQKTIGTGLWLTENTDMIGGVQGIGFKHYTFLTCFTDIKLHDALLHARKYGLLGIGFSRKFVQERDGNPVFYLKNDKKDIYPHIIWEIIEHLEHLTKADGTDDKYLYSRFSLLMNLVKPMSDYGQDNYKYIEESEWRIVFNNTLESRGLIRSSGLPKPPFYVPFTLADVSVLVLPNRKARNQICQNSAITAWLSSTTSATPLVISLEETLDF